MPRKLFLYRLRTLFAISLMWLVFGVVFHYNLIHPTNDLGVRLSLLRFVLTFGIIGLLITAVLIFYFKPAFYQWPLWLGVLMKMAIAVVLFVVIAFVLALIYFVVVYNRSFSHFFHSFFTKIVYTKTFTIFLIDMGIMTLLSIMLLEIMDKYGPGLFWSFLIGEYNTPVMQNRIFVFLDMNQSTVIAEKLGHEKYFRMLRRVYRDITVPVLTNDGTIYQYVGDEVVLTWLNTPENKIKCLKFVRNTYYLIERMSKRYETLYGRAPHFKAGLHVGDVTAGFIGVIKRELIYSGDTLNTTARIRSRCNKLNESFLVSADFMEDFPLPYGYRVEPKGEINLRGKEEPMILHALKFE